MQLRQALRRTHTRIALTAVAVASVLLLAAGLTALRANTQDNLDLMARSLVYNVEAALVFGDKLDATESLTRMVRNEGVAEAVVWDAQGKVFAQWVAPNGLPCNCGSELARVLGLSRMSLPTGWWWAGSNSAAMASACWRFCCGAGWR